MTISNFFISSTLFFCVLTTASAQTQVQDTISASDVGVKFFDGSFGEALELAKKEDKALFVNANVKWSSACTWMTDNTFSKGTTGAYYNENFICVSIDCEKGEGPEFAAKYEIKTYPTLLFLNQKGEVYQSSKGTKTPDTLVALGKTVIAQHENAVYELKIKTSSAPKAKKKKRRKKKDES